MKSPSDTQGKKVTEDTHKAPQRSKDTDTISCAVCGRSEAPSELSWKEGRQGWLCEMCRAEEESCGCSDD